MTYVGTFACDNQCYPMTDIDEFIVKARSEESRYLSLSTLRVTLYILTHF